MDDAVAKVNRPALHHRTSRADSGTASVRCHVARPHVRDDSERMERFEPIEQGRHDPRNGRRQHAAPGPGHTARNG